MDRLLLAVPLAFCLALITSAVPPEQTKTKDGRPTPEAAAARASVAGNLKATVWAAEPMFQNPVAFGFDEKGRCYVVEGNRYKDGVPDTRGHMYWLDEDIACRSVADRVAMYKKHHYSQFEKFEDRLRVLWDSEGKGVADKAETFSGGYNRFEDGIAAGVLARKGTVYFTCIPDLYTLRDTNGDGKADVKTSLASGFGVRAQFQGHDLHGLRIGPDGKLYFSIGDRGLNVTTQEGKRLFYPDAGAVLRCDLDGANLEIVHTGLRNPQELAFDDFGNLFTYDNNCDSGDSARWVAIVAGGDSGWRCGYQYGTLMHTAKVPQGNRGPWNTEGLWHLQHPDQPAYVLPPLAHFGNGPAGLTHYPGVGLAEEYQDHFFACDFTANPTNSTIWTLAVKPKGAAFEVAKLRPFIKGVVPTDCEFGPDGGFYWSDWIGGWDKPNQGRIFRTIDPTAMKNPAIEDARKMLAEGLESRKLDELYAFLGHAHQNLRLEAQLELAQRATKEHKAIAFKLAFIAMNPNSPRLARLHAVWGLGMIEGGGQKSTLLLQSAKSLLKSDDVELRVATVKTLGKYKSAWLTLRTALSSDADLRVKANILLHLGELLPENAAEAIGSGRTSTAKLSDRLQPAFEILSSNADKDVYLRHAAVVCLVQTCQDQPAALFAEMRANREAIGSPAVRLGVVLALRRLKSPLLGEFLNDADTRIVAEAARAIHDENVSEAMQPLAALLSKPIMSDAIAFRAISAAFKQGRDTDAQRLATFGTQSSVPDHQRVAALKLLSEWAKPSKRDAITGLMQQLPERDAAVAVAAIKPYLALIFKGSDAVRKEAVQLVSKLGITEVGSILAALVQDSKQSSNTRVDGLFALENLKAKELLATAEVALKQDDVRVRAAARVVLAKANEIAAVKELPALLNDEKVSIIEKQMVLGVMGEMKSSKEIDDSLAVWLDKLTADQVPAELKLDIVEAAQARSSRRGVRLQAPLREKLDGYDKAVRAKAGNDTVKRYPETLFGGDIEKGRDIVLNNAAVYCQRCHKLDGQGGDVGPILNGIAATKNRDYLLESIINPTAQIAQGYQSVILNTLDGKQISGVLKSKDAKNYTLISPENKIMTVPVDDVEGPPKPDKSAMPDDLYKKLSKRELRDVIEFLASLKVAPKP